MENENNEPTVLYAYEEAAKKRIEQSKEFLKIIIEKGITKNYIISNANPEPSQKWFYWVVNPQNMDCKVLIGLIPAITDKSPIHIKNNNKIISKPYDVMMLLNELGEGYVGGENGNISKCNIKDSEYPYPLEVTELIKLNDLDSDPVFTNLDALTENEFKSFRNIVHSFKTIVKNYALDIVQAEMLEAKQAKENKGEENDE